MPSMMPTTFLQECIWRDGFVYIVFFLAVNEMFFSRYCQMVRLCYIEYKCEIIAKVGEKRSFPQEAMK